MPGAKCATADSGTIVSCPVLTAAPVEALLLPLAASAFCVALRAVVLKPLGVLAAAAASPVTVPAGALVTALPDGLPPVVLIQIWFRMSGFCQYSGATSMTTWYWFSAL